MTEDELKTAANAVQERASGGDLDEAYRVLGEELRLAAREADVGSYLPGGSSSELGMAANRQDGRTFYDVFKKRLRDKLCDDEGELRKLAELGTHATAAEVVTVLLAAVHLPPELTGILYPIAAIIALTGVEAFCTRTA